MNPINRLARVLPTIVLAVVVCSPQLASAQDEGAAVAPVAQSPEKVNELVALLQSRELTSFAVPDPDAQGRFVAVLHIPNVQLILVAAKYGRSTDIEYRLFEKDYMTIYMDLSSGVLATDKFFVDDTRADGLVLVPDEGGAGDSVRVGDVAQAFDGEFTPYDKKPKEDVVGEADYYKAFADADQRYARLVGLLVDELNKGLPGLAQAARPR